MTPEKNPDAVVITWDDLHKASATQGFEAISYAMVTIKKHFIAVLGSSGAASLEVLFVVQHSIECSVGLSVLISLSKPTVTAMHSHR